MKHEKVLKKVIARLGIEPTEGYNGKFSVVVGDKLASWYRSRHSGEASSFHIRRVDDIPDSMTDYFPGWYPDNITQFLDHLNPPPPKFPIGALVIGKHNKRATRQGFAGKPGLVQEHSPYGGSCRVYWDGVPGTAWISERDLLLVS